MAGLPINWFDLTLMVVLVAGAVIGRKKGLSEELLPGMQWLAVVALGALFYKPIGKFLSAYTGLSLLLSYICSYLFVALLIGFVFGWIRTLVGEKLVSGDAFGRLEFPLGMLAGVVRFVCIVLVMLALLHARYFSPQELAAQARMQRENFGSISFPTLGLLQKSVFAESVSGRFIKKYFDQQLITATSPSARAVERLGIGKRREKIVNETLGEPSI